MSSSASTARPWDTPGLPPRSEDERCGRHKWCAYRDDDPAYCPLCHARHELGTGSECGVVYVDTRGRAVDSTTHPTLRLGQYAHPQDEGKRRAEMPISGANAIARSDWATGLFAAATGGDTDAT